MKRVLAGFILLLMVIGALDVLREPSAQMSTKGAILLVRKYKKFISPRISGAVTCRFLPTCSDYAVIALGEYGIVRGGWRTIKRLARCSPLSHEHGDDYP